jgi:hypothetical protein
MKRVIGALLLIVIFCFSSENVNAQKISATNRHHSLYLKELDKGKRERMRRIYNMYLKDKKIPAKCSYLMLNNLSRAGLTIETSDAFDCVNSYLAILDHNQKIDQAYKQIVLEELGKTYGDSFSALIQSVNQVWSRASVGCPLEASRAHSL